MAQPFGRRWAGHGRWLALLALLEPVAALAAGAPLAGVLAAPPASMPPPADVEPDLLFTLGGKLTELYTDNVFATPSNGQADVDNQLSVDLGLKDRGAHFTLDASYQLTADLYAANPSLDGVLHNLEAFANGEIVPHTLLLQARAFATPVSLNNDLGPLTASQRSLPSGADAGQSGSLGYEIEPEWKARLGDLADSTLALEQGAVYLPQPGSSPGQPSFFNDLPSVPTTTLETILSERLSSGTALNRLQWNLSLSDAETGGSSLKLSERSVLGELGYAVTRQITPLLDLGGQTYHSSSPLSQNPGGLVAMAGARLTFGPALGLTFEGGRQLGGSSFTGDLHFIMTPHLMLVGSLSDQIDTPASRMLENLRHLRTTPGGGFVDDRLDQLSQGEGLSSLAADPAAFSAVPLDNVFLADTIDRYRTASATLIFDRERDSARLGVYLTRSNILSALPYGLNPSSRAYGADLMLSHRLTRATTASIDASYAHDSAFSPTTTIFHGDLDLTYELTPKMSVTARAGFIRRYASGPDVAAPGADINLSEAELSLALQRSL